MFYVDDNFASSDPVMKMPRARRAAAVGLWTLAGTWSARFLKDGWVPAHMVEEYGSQADAELLVTVKLWRRRGTGFVFVDWARWQRTREQAEAYKKAERDRKAAYRAAKAARSGAGPGAVPAGQVRDSETPSPHPHPSPGLDIDRSQLKLPSGSPQPGDGPVQKARGNPTGVDLEAVAAVLDEVLAGVHPQRLDLAAIADHFLERGGHRVKYPTRYVLGCIRDDPNRVANFIHTGRWSE